ncbi:uncharacterized protein PV07_01049 [Cladophialophora immunda]|uniref:Uncharacterized protein n=1 Tax=Cladophialophora immunda TaxID=569365 RepID=A0A0D2CSV6_9EURO|nr:uncharacterized protein PV07_01049 [Cladophialophora immunda]KIW34258.1 hypothetical protein PV07_01049 [Cladophialophora immunda]OQU99087.1 hypothetical protein CLAIMM_04774 [Cladophialophora immunda]
MVTFYKLAATSVLAIYLTAAAPVKTIDFLGPRIKCLALGCTHPDQPHPYVGSITHMVGSDVFPLGSEKVEDFAERGDSEVVIPKESKMLVKNSIVKRPLEVPVDEETKDPDHGKRDLQKQLEPHVVEEAHEASTLASDSPLHPTRTYDMPESAQPGTTARNPLLKAENKLVSGLQHAVQEWGGDHGKN